MVLYAINGRSGVLTDANTHSNVFAATSVPPSESLIALGPCGAGQVGYVGDANYENETTQVIGAIVDRCFASTNGME